MLENLKKYRAQIEEGIEQSLKLLEKSVQGKITLPDNFLETIREYALRGKMIRGSLVLFIHSVLANNIHGTAMGNVSAVAVAMELLQCMLLIHDDIMDKAMLRRNKPALHQKLAQQGRVDGVQDYKHFGTSLAICTGDVLTFCAYHCISQASFEGNILQRIIRLVSEELSLVGIAQTQDMFLAEGTIDTLSKNAILNIYRAKTGRYTFSLPMLLGAITCNSAPELCTKLESLGEKFGILFQVKDDEIGLLGNPNETGKPNDSDIAEGKKTIHIALLAEMLNAKDRVELQRIFTNYRGSKDRDWVLEHIHRYSINDRVYNFLKPYVESAKNTILSISHTKLRKGLMDLLEYNLHRIR